MFIGNYYPSISEKNRKCLSFYTDLIKSVQRNCRYLNWMRVLKAYPRKKNLQPLPIALKVFNLSTVDVLENPPVIMNNFCPRTI